MEPPMDPPMDPIEQLAADRQTARANGDPCANLCTTATVDADNQPQARTLVLRDVDSRLALFLNQTSPKWEQISQSGVICVVVWLPSLNIQYRVQSHVEPVAKGLVDESWLLRPDVPKQLDWFYTTQQAQSSQLPSRDALLQQLAATDEQHYQRAPATAQGWYLLPFYIDRLDLSHSSGVHDRRAFSLRDGQWQESVLVP
jgi:pyridoxamine 5'-phosphate oxidase